MIFDLVSIVAPWISTFFSLSTISKDIQVLLTNAMLRVALERAGNPIGGNDLLIAAQTLALGLILVIGNAKEFFRIPELIIENWLA